jgi:hypothetical protein|tara:strand:+ start:660 stop:980 length:321 start_codon:yes stop_codon:yes gene_type:complete
MTSKQILNNAVNTTANTAQDLFTAGTSAVVIESFTATNNSTVNASYKAYIVSGGIEQPQIPFKIVVWGENDLGIGIVNQVIPAGAQLKLESSAINSIYFTATGRTV